MKKRLPCTPEQYSSRESFETIFFGGGTPSLLPPSTLERILNTLHSHYQINSGAEITVETNPGTVDAEKLEDTGRSASTG